jgi:curved DNA-binding protein
MNMATVFKDYYETLGIDAKATGQEIKNAYRKAARKYHPDLHTQSEKAAAEEKFKEINEAYTVLSDAEKRAQYDRLGENQKSGQEWQPSAETQGYVHHARVDAGEDNFSDFFESLFGSAGLGGPQEGFRQGRSTRGRDLESELALTLEEAYHGGRKTLQFSAQTICPACNGTGIAYQKPCQVCGGTASNTINKILDVQIPPFVRDGSKVRLKGQGGEGPVNGMQGDLLLTIRIIPHARFALIENNLETVVRINPEQAVLGCQIPIPSMDGELTITISPMAHNGQKLRLRSKGWADKDGNRGNMYVKITIDIPRSLSPAQLELYHRLADL